MLVFGFCQHCLLAMALLDKGEGLGLRSLCGRLVPTFNTSEQKFHGLCSLCGCHMAAAFVGKRAFRRHRCLRSRLMAVLLLGKRQFC